MTTPNHEALARAIERKGTQAGLAEAIGTTQSLVGYWLNKSKRGVSADWVKLVEAATGIPRHELRPDLYDPPAVIPPAMTEAACLRSSSLR